MRFLTIAIILLLSLQNCSEVSVIDYQGHRGARGLYPENTIPSFLHALEYPKVQTLEMDVVLTKDGTVVVSHDPWMHAQICISPTGEKLNPADSARISILSLRIDEVQAYDCGSLVHPRFPEQKKMVVRKPRMAQVFAAVERYCAENNRSLPDYNIEIKYLPEWETANFVADIKTNVEAVLADVKKAGLSKRVTIQCFHPPVLAELRNQAPEIRLAYLDEFPQKGNVKQKMEALGFVPPIYSPYYLPLTKEVVGQCHELGMQVTPWTVNETEDMKRLLEMGVNGIITDYPNRIPAE